MKKYIIIFLVSGWIILSGCDKYLDMNTNPNYPSEVASNRYMSPIIANMALGVQFDARVVGKLVQNWSSTAANDVWERHGYAPGSDGGGEIWRAVYFKLGNNLNDMIRIAEEEQRWDIAGAGKIIKAWGWQTLTDYHGEIILKEAYRTDLNKFNYDSQEEVYAEVVRLCKEGIVELERTDGAVSKTYMAQGDMMYKGDRSKWIKFAYGLLAMNALHISNKPSYNPALVVEYAKKSFADNNDDALVPFDGITSADANYFGPKRAIITAFRQSAYIVSLMKGEAIPGVTDPRMSRMLVASADGGYWGVPTGLGQAVITVANRRPGTPWNTAGAPPVNTIGRYLFHDNSKFPLMTYSQIQFILAEAALKTNTTEALQAYKNGIAAHMDFVNRANTEIAAPGVTAISATEKANYLANTAVVPTTPAGLTVSKILLQKYIAQYGWGFIETWSDIRRYHYDPTVLNGFMPLVQTSLYPDNNGKYAYRYRPRYNSEYVWNQEALAKIGALNPDYHTVETWFSKP